MHRPVITVYWLDRDCGAVICAAVFIFMLGWGISLLPVSEACKEWLFWGLWAAGAIYVIIALVRGVLALRCGGGLNTLKK